MRIIEQGQEDGGKLTVDITHWWIDNEIYYRGCLFAEDRVLVATADRLDKVLRSLYKMAQK